MAAPPPGMLGPSIPCAPGACFGGLGTRTFLGTESELQFFFIKPRKRFYSYRFVRNISDFTAGQQRVNPHSGCKNHMFVAQTCSRAHLNAQLSISQFFRSPAQQPAPTSEQGCSPPSQSHLQGEGSSSPNTFSLLQVGQCWLPRCMLILVVSLSGCAKSSAPLSFLAYLLHHLQISLVIT